MRIQLWNIWLLNTVLSLISLCWYVNADMYSVEVNSWREYNKNMTRIYICYMSNSAWHIPECLVTCCAWWQGYLWGYITYGESKAWIWEISFNTSSVGECWQPWNVVTEAERIQVTHSGSFHKWQGECSMKLWCMQNMPCNTCSLCYINLINHISSVKYLSADFL